MTCSELPPIAVSCGDPSGIAPEIIVAAWQALKDELPFFVIGDPGHVPEGASVSVINAPEAAASVMADGLPVLPHAFRKPAKPGKPSRDNAVAVVEVIRRAVDLVQDGRASALCTAPVSKYQLVEFAGFEFPGHTEFLADLTNTPTPVMMLASDDLKVVPATIHLPLALVPKALTAEGLEKTVRVTEAALRQDFGLTEPRLALTGLNPHAGEGGLMGGEDDAVIAPLVARLSAEGMAITGPHPADTMFHEAARASYDVAVAMYHDQALIPIKTLAFDKGVNITLGLPFPRTSPDHGTAYDIAGKGIANPASMIAALRMAGSMARARRAANTA